MNKFRIRNGAKAIADENIRKEKLLRFPEITNIILLMIVIIIIIMIIMIIILITKSY